MQCGLQNVAYVVELSVHRARPHSAHWVNIMQRRAAFYLRQLSTPVPPVPCNIFHSQLHHHVHSHFHWIFPIIIWKSRIPISDADLYSILAELSRNKQVYAERLAFLRNISSLSDDEIEPVSVPQWVKPLLNRPPCLLA